MTPSFLKIAQLKLLTLSEIEIDLQKFIKQLKRHEGVKAFRLSGDINKLLTMAKKEDDYLAPHFVQRSNWLRAAVLGANDGILSTASLAIGIAAAKTGGSNIKKAVIRITFWGTATMGITALAGYLFGVNLG